MRFELAGCDFMGKSSQSQENAAAVVAGVQSKRLGKPVINELKQQYHRLHRRHDMMARQVRLRPDNFTVCIDH